MYSAYNHPALDYKSVLEILKERSETNTSQTSSLPLAAFWYPKRNENQKNQLFQGIGMNNADIFDSQNVEYNFEYPTPAYDNKEPGKTLENSKPSMTDLMILLNDTEETRITIEAKYTEYVKGKNYDPLKTWYKGKPQHKTNILECWINYIGKRGKISSVRELEESAELLNRNNNIKFPYQFLHRAASACFSCKHPILVYQLFYDNDKKSLKKKDEFKKLLSDCANILLYDDKLPFFIVETEVNECPNPDIWNKKSKENHSDLLFCKMIDDENLYTFGKEITVLNGYDLKQVTPKQ